MARASTDIARACHCHRNGQRRDGRQRRLRNRRLRSDAADDVGTGHGQRISFARLREVAGGLRVEHGPRLEKAHHAGRHDGHRQQKCAGVTQGRQRPTQSFRQEHGRHTLSEQQLEGVQIDSSYETGCDRRAWPSSIVSSRFLVDGRLINTRARYSFSCHNRFQLIPAMVLLPRRTTSLVDVDRSQGHPKDIPMTLRRPPAFTVMMIAIVGFSVQAEAQAPCPELGRLRDTANEAWKQAMRGPPSERCGSLHHAASATQATLDYANNNRESCGISDPLRSQVEKDHRRAVQARDNVCAGRPLRPFPPDIIQH